MTIHKKWKFYLILSLFIQFSLFKIDAEAISSIPAFLTEWRGADNTLLGPTNELNIIHSFPKDNYQICEIKNQSSFYVDGRDDCIKNRLRRGIPWEPDTQKLIQKYARQGSTVVDLGAHIGTHTVTLSHCVGENGRVIAFEPQMKIYMELVMNLQLNQCHNVTAYRAALGDRRGAVQMQISPQNNEGGTMIGSGGDYVLLFPLDYFELNSISFIKIDVENFEYQVLLGAKETIARNRPVMLIEIMGNEVPHKQESVNKTLDLLKQMGYDVSHFLFDDYLAIPIDNIVETVENFADRTRDFH